MTLVPTRYHIPLSLSAKTGQILHFSKDFSIGVEQPKIPIHCLCALRVFMVQNQSLSDLPKLGVLGGKTLTLSAASILIYSQSLSTEQFYGAGQIQAQPKRSLPNSSVN